MIRQKLSGVDYRMPTSSKVSWNSNFDVSPIPSGALTPVNKDIDLTLKP